MTADPTPRELLASHGLTVGAPAPGPAGRCAILAADGVVVAHLHAFEVFAWIAEREAAK